LQQGRAGAEEAGGCKSKEEPTAQRRKISLIASLGHRGGL
jgi:hypothetical protein